MYEQQGDGWLVAPDGVAACGVAALVLPRPREPQVRHLPAPLAAPDLRRSLGRAAPDDPDRQALRSGAEGDHDGPPQGLRLGCAVEGEVPSAGWMMPKNLVAWIGLGISLLGLVFTAGMFYNRVVIVEDAVDVLQKTTSTPAVDPSCARLQRDVEKLRASVNAIRDQLIYRGWDPVVVPQPMMPPLGAARPSGVR